MKHMVRKFPPFLSEREKGTTSGGSVQSNELPENRVPFKLLNRNFRISWLSSKHCWTPENNLPFLPVAAD